MLSVWIMALLPWISTMDLPSSNNSMSGNGVYASVFLVRGAVSGSTVGRYGAFRRNDDDTTWALLNRSNVITFGLGRFQLGDCQRLYIAGGNGVHRSTDGGRTWKILTSWHTMEILSLAADPLDSARIYAATPGGIYRTTDDGQTWILKSEGCHRLFAQKMLIDCRDPRTLFAAMEDDLYRTTDGGDSWLPMRVGADEVQAIAQDPRTPTRLLASAEDAGIWLSTDDGKTWSPSTGLRGETVYALRFSPDGTIVYAAGWKTGLWRSADGGESWALIWNDPAVEAVFDVAVDPEDSRHILVGTDGQGVYESLDGGSIWQRAGLMGAKVKQLEFYH